MMGSPLDKIEAEMKRLIEFSENETDEAHNLADDLLIELIRILKTIATDVQVERILASYSEVHKWYS